jgi:hypothetical protein
VPSSVIERQVKGWRLLFFLAFRFRDLVSKTCYAGNDLRGFLAALLERIPGAPPTTLSPLITGGNKGSTKSYWTMRSAVRQSNFDSPVDTGLDQPGPGAAAEIALPLGRSKEGGVEDFGDGRSGRGAGGPSLRKLLPADTLTLRRAGVRSGRGDNWVPAEGASSWHGQSRCPRRSRSIPSNRC